MDKAGEAGAATSNHAAPAAGIVQARRCRQRGDWQMERIPGCGNWRIRYRIIEERLRNAGIASDAGNGRILHAGEVDASVDAAGTSRDADPGATVSAAGKQQCAGVEILRAVTCDQKALFPGEIQGLPVVKIAGHALSADRWDTDGEPGALDVELTDGRTQAADEEWGNRGIRDLWLPEKIREVGDYAFLNCRNMQRLELADREIVWQRACFMNCRALRYIVLRRERMEEDRGNLAYFAGETTGELDVTIRAGGAMGGHKATGIAAASDAANCGTADSDIIAGGADCAGEARLIFPDYLELYTENNEARQFDYTIEGAGYPYRHVFRNKQLNWHDYDSLWRTYLGRETDKARAARMAWYRVSRPAGLAAEHRADYELYVKDHFLELAEQILSEDPGAGDGQSAGEEMARLVRLASPHKALLAEAAALARSRGRTDCLAVLMEEEHRHAPAPSGRRKSYEL